MSDLEREKFEALICTFCEKPAVSFVLGWWINKATMLESLYRESKKVQAAPAGKEGNNGAQ